MKSQLSDRMREYVRACFTGIWIHSHEFDDALRELAILCRSESWHLSTWDLAQGLRQIQGTEVPAGESDSDLGLNGDPVSAIRSLENCQNPQGACILVLKNFHRFIASAEVMETMNLQLTRGKQNRTLLVVISPVIQIPTELERQFVIIDHELPDRKQLREIAEGTWHGKERLCQSPR